MTLTRRTFQFLAVASGLAGGAFAASQRKTRSVTVDSTHIRTGAALMASGASATDRTSAPPA
jgi:hypothetical protein